MADTARRFTYQLKLTEVLSAANDHKTSGNENFKKQNYSSALRQYSAGLKKLDGCEALAVDIQACLDAAGPDPENAGELETLLSELGELCVACASNATQCSPPRRPYDDDDSRLARGAAAGNLKLKRFKDAVATAKRALKAAPSNAKALFRLGFAYEKLKKWPEAEKASAAAPRAPRAREKTSRRRAGTSARTRRIRKTRR